MNDNELIYWNQLGLIPGPSESEGDFKKRVDFCLGIKKNFLKEIEIPGSAVSDDSCAEGLLLAKKLYGVFPQWVPIFFSNYRLSPWHGGAAWIFQLTEDSPLAALLQLRKVFYKKENYLGIYNRTELIAHEMAHVGRMAFEEKKYEELLAYKSSACFFSKTFGPLIQSAFESRLIVYLLATLFLMDAYFLFQGSMNAYIETQVFKILPFTLILYALFRLKQRNRKLAQVEKKLKGIMGENSSYLLYRLTDKEIHIFAQLTPDAIEAYIKSQESFRWKVLKLSYKL